MSHLTVVTGDAFATLLELAANNDIEGFSQLIGSDPSGLDEVGLWYGRQKGSKQMVLEHRTPLMVAAMYGSVDVLKLILSQSKADVNRSCGVDKTTALHCAASGGSLNAVEIIKLLLLAGADPNLIDVNGLRPVDVIVVSPKFPDKKKTLEELLGVDGESSLLDSNLRSPSPENGSPVSESDLVSSPKISTFSDNKREYPVDPSLPDIKNSIYSTDEFRMYSFKVRPCSRAYSHDWTECPFVHPGENARRRDPRKYHYSCVPCPDFRKGTCRRGDMCEYAHGVFECWLHPAQYRTRLCKDGTSCNRRVCFFAHTQDELRPLFVSTGSAVPSPRSTNSGPNALDFAAAMSLMPGSLSSFTPPMSPSANGMSNMNWPQPNVPSLHLPGSNLQSSRLRSSLNARDISDQDLNLQLFNELSRQQRAAHNQSILTPTKLDDIFAAESSSPRFSDQSVYSPRHNSSVFNQFQQQQSMLSPINTNFSPKNASFAVQSPGRMSPRSVEPISPMSSRVSMLARENQHQQQFRSLSSRELGSRSGAILGSAVDPWSKWGPTGEKADWGVNADDFGKLRRSSSFENGGNNGEEPDLSWVQSLVKETPQEMKEKLAAFGGSGGEGSGNGGGSGSNSNTQIEQMDQSALSAWIEQMQLDHLVAQQN
ncbi:zinc finger CCCH domain-containing protein 30-like [Cynara cardunculus var. scolymus]|uniref:Ankyrin repeat-containing protein n=1 Tax=Cynara cardunculus var. scolymus TaxID=59895 RepID=A0A103YLG9_CYNCS|nr:zinc finger CCCH domain-containing protein 30-like [Cynara cardunculus var. scolymus]XP_024967875.1 zinc finger CCCH domain-containing protein 30-like [Cynara cardunculus var. scolymus]KVI11345.1 Ankyrin repeat-containing protein [Cynara cardunculus var. scolymus]